MERLTNTQENRKGTEPFSYWLKDSHPLEQLKAFKKLADYEDFAEIFEKHLSKEALELLSDKEEFLKWLERGKWTAIQCDKSYREAQAFKDKQEQGLLIELPCKVGDTVYLTERLTVARGTEILKCNVDEFTVTTSGCYAVLNGNESYYALRRFRAVKIDNFGERVFLTHSEAEEALAKMGE